MLYNEQPEYYSWQLGVWKVGELGMGHRKIETLPPFVIMYNKNICYIEKGGVVGERVLRTLLLIIVSLY